MCFKYPLRILNVFYWLQAQTTGRELSISGEALCVGDVRGRGLEGNRVD